jgi:phospholipid/cholesterol/gamma-HCH transport system ATP-binding protein
VTQVPPMAERDGDAPPPVEVRDLTMAYNTRVVMQQLNVPVARGEIFVIMGGSGSGKTTLLKCLVGLEQPTKGEILFDGKNFGTGDQDARKRVLRRMGVLFQNGALWSGLTLAENVALPLEEFTNLEAGAIGEVVSSKLALVGLGGFESFYPAEIGGGSASVRSLRAPLRWTRTCCFSTSCRQAWTPSARVGT